MTKKYSKNKFIGGLAVAFLLPLSFYFIAKLLSKDQIHLPHYYIADKIESKTVDGKTMRDTTFHRVPDARFINQFGKEVSINQDLSGKIIVANLFFINCQSVCPKLNANMRMLMKAFAKSWKSERSMDTMVHFVSITVDPANDSFQALRLYADGIKADHDHWWFLTGNRDNILDYVRNELHISMQPSDGGVEELTHSETIVVLDQERYIRGYYNGLDTVELRRCADDIVLLTLEKKRKKK